MRDAITNALKFWEPLRLLYNAVLAMTVIGYFVAAYPGSRAALTVDVVLVVFLLAVLANVAYCAAYRADLFAQASRFRDVWLRLRWILFAVGLVFAGILTRFFAMGFFHHG